MNSQPIRFTCEVDLHERPEEIAGQILDLSKWPEFEGYGPLPGIEAAEFEVRTASNVGTKIRVKNCDGTAHIEEIVEWEPTKRLRLLMYDFSAPVSHLASHFDETWHFERRNGKTHVSRTFAMHPKSTLTRPFVWIISLMLKRAIARHLDQLAQAT